MKISTKVYSVSGFFSFVAFVYVFYLFTNRNCTYEKTVYFNLHSKETFVSNYSSY